MKKKLTGVILLILFVMIPFVMPLEAKANKKFEGPKPEVNFNRSHCNLNTLVKKDVVKRLDEKCIFKCHEKKKNLLDMMLLSYRPHS